MTGPKTVIITGASSGIGRSTALRFAERGAHVVLAARRTERLREVAEGVSDNGGTATVQPTDVTDTAAVRDLVRTARSAGDTIDAVVNAAGIMETGPAHTGEVTDWYRMLDVNLLGSMRVTRAVLGEMRRRGSGDIVFVSSINADNPSADGSGYSASKAGVSAFAESVRREVADTDIRISVVEPGLVDSAMQPQAVVEDHPTLDPTEVAESILFATERPPAVNVNRIQVRPTKQRF